MKYPIFFGLVAAELGLLAALHLHASADAERHARERADTGALVAALGLTDLAIWTEARYTRHPSQADRFAAFQDFPGSIEHFPAGSIIGPPAALRTPELGAAPLAIQGDPSP